MAEITLESLAARLDAIEKLLVDRFAIVPARKDWRQLIGTMEDNEFTRSWIAEMEATREAEREAARAGRIEDAVE